MSGSGRVGYVMAMAAGGLVVWGVMVHGAEPEHHAVTPVQVVAAPVPASAYVCAVRCPGYVPERGHDVYVPAPLPVQGPIPTSGVVTVYLPAPTQGGAAVPVKTQKAQPKQSQAKAQPAPKAPRQAAAKAPKQSQPSTTVTVTQKTSTTSKGTTTSSTTTKTMTKG